MFLYTGFGYGFWWVFPVIMIAMMALCFFMMRGQRGPMMMCGGSHRADGGRKDPTRGDGVNPTKSDNTEVAG